MKTGTGGFAFEYSRTTVGVDVGVAEIWRIFEISGLYRYSATPGAFDREYLVIELTTRQQIGGIGVRAEWAKANAKISLGINGVIVWDQFNGHPNTTKSFSISFIDAGGMASLRLGAALSERLSLITSFEMLVIPSLDHEDTTVDGLLFEVNRGTTDLFLYVGVSWDI